MKPITPEEWFAVTIFIQDDIEEQAQREVDDAAREGCALDYSATVEYLRLQAER